MFKKDTSHIDRVLGRYKADEFLKLFDRWIGQTAAGRLLKTDLREEAFGEDQILFSLPAGKLDPIGIDIDRNTALSAWRRAGRKYHRFHCIVSDVRDMPFGSSVFDAVVSTSTLDHFEEGRDLGRSLKELSRVAKPGAPLLLALNNNNNVSFYFSILLGRMFGLVQYPVRFYDLGQARKACEENGWSVEDTDFAVHIISPANRLLLLLRLFLRPSLADKISKVFVNFFSLLGSCWIFKRSTAWFIVLKCLNKK